MFSLISHRAGAEKLITISLNEFFKTYHNIKYQISISCFFFSSVGQYIVSHSSEQSLFPPWLKTGETRKKKKQNKAKLKIFTLLRGGRWAY